MPRSLRMVVSDESTAYHIISRTALDGLPFGDIEKEALVDIIKKFSSIYFADVLGYAVMGNHFHLLVTMHTEMRASDAEIRHRYSLLYGEKTVFPEGKISHFRNKWCNLSEFIKEIKQTFSRFYNKRYDRKGTLWGERFKSVILERGEAVVRCLSYIDLNPVRAGIVKRPEAYRWCSMGYHAQTGNRDGFLSLDFGFVDFGVEDPEDRLIRYREYMYHAGSLEKEGKGAIPRSILENEVAHGFKISGSSLVKGRIRHFTESGVIGSRAFVEATCRRFKNKSFSTRARIPRVIEGGGGLFVVKRVSDT
ncbi:transposase [Desulfoluna butyratoxydans]|uniref:Transposase is200-like n=1 Tax=Desulfoluna butyratoxydans TaxID=231438 RepID=A0A4U8YHI9_9BACT|nr:transposase [Desulfoluna butyratoxydans]VFQ43011.1 transposase is200-like [Desulfoluna butyratoxydans]